MNVFRISRQVSLVFAISIDCYVCDAFDLYLCFAFCRNLMSHILVNCMQSFRHSPLIYLRYRYAFGNLDMNGIQWKFLSVVYKYMMLHLS